MEGTFEADRQAGETREDVTYCGNNISLCDIRHDFQNVSKNLNLFRGKIQECSHQE